MMRLYHYDIRTTAGESFGTIEAANEAAARKLLEQQHAGKLQNEKGKEFDNEVTDLTLTPIDFVMISNE